MKFLAKILLCLLKFICVLVYCTFKELVLLFNGHFIFFS